MRRQVGRSMHSMCSVRCSLRTYSQVEPVQKGLFRLLCDCLGSSGSPARCAHWLVSSP